MDKRFLEECLAQGLSLDQIGERAGKHPSTISFHLKKFGLIANGTQRHSPRGELGEELFQQRWQEG